MFVIAAAKVVVVVVVVVGNHASDELGVVMIVVGFGDSLLFVFFVKNYLWKKEYNNTTLNY